MKMKKMVAVSLGTIMISSLLAGCGDKTPNAAQPTPTTDSKLNLSGLPIVKEPTTIKIFSPKNFSTQNLNDIMLWNEYKKMTNINVVWNDVNGDQLAEKKNIVLASGDYPDAFFGSYFSNTDLVKYGGQGAFVKLNDLIDKYAPNLKAIFDKNPEIRKAITMPDGNIYSLPIITDPSFKALRSGTFMWFQQQWLDKLGMPLPKTTDELYDLLKQIKEKDPNSIPIGGGAIGTLTSLIRGSWGLGNRGTSNFDIDPKSGSLRFIPASTEYKEMLQYISKLYTEGLLDKDIFSQSGDQRLANATQGKYAVTVSNNPEAVFKQKGYVGGLTLKGPHGDQLYANVRSLVLAPGQFVITNSNKNPEATMRWADYLYSDEGSKMFFMGFENVTYNKTAEGKYQYVDEIKNNPKGLTQDQAVAQYLTWPGGYYAGVVRQQFFQGAEGMPASLEAIKKVEPDFPKEVWTSFTYTPEETEKMSVMQTDINTYVTEMLAKFVTGKSSFTEWDQYIATLQKMKLDEYLKIVNGAYERYKK